MWAFPGWYDEGWWRNTTGHDCTIEQMEHVAEGHFRPGDILRNPTSEQGFSGITPEEFNQMYNIRTNYTSPFGTSVVSQAYDAVWAMALALNATENQLIEIGRYHNINRILTYTNPPQYHGKTNTMIWNDTEN